MISKAVSLFPSTVTWHLKKLQTVGVIMQRSSGEGKGYTVAEPDKVAEILGEYRESFSNTIVDRFYEMWGT